MELVLCGNVAEKWDIKCTVHFVLYVLQMRVDAFVS